MLPFVVVPSPGESLHGFERRLCDANFIPNLRQWRGSAGIRGITPTSGNEALWLRLSEVSGQSIQELKKMRWEPAESSSLLGLVKFNGQLVQKKFLRTGRLRICPDCIKHSDRISDAWALYYAVACPIHHRALVDHCDSCDDGKGNPRRLQVISAAHPWECKCGHYFGDIGAPPASPALTIAMGALFRNLEGSETLRTGCQKLSAPFETLSPNDLLTIIDILGIAATTDQALDENVEADGVRYRQGLLDHSLTLEECSVRVEAATAIMEDWPRAYFDLLDKVAYRNKTAQHEVTERRAFATAVGQMLLFPRRSLNGEPLMVLQEAVDSYCSEQLNIRRRRRNLATTLPIANALPQTASIEAVTRNIKGNASRARVRIAYEDTLRKLWRASSFWNPEDLAERLQAGVEARLEACANSVSSVTAARLLEGTATDRRLTGWNHPELLPPNLELDQYFGKRRESYRLGDVEAVKAYIFGLVQSCEGMYELVTVREALQTLLIFGYKKQQLLLDIKNSQISVFGETDNLVLLDLMIDPLQANRRIVEWLKASCRAAPQFISLHQAHLLNKRAGVDFADLTSSNMISLRREGTVGFKVNSMFDGKRKHPSYRYRLSDILP